MRLEELEDVPRMYERRRVGVLGPKFTNKPKNLPPGQVWVEVGEDFIPVNRQLIKTATERLAVRGASPSGEPLD